VIAQEDCWIWSLIASASVAGIVSWCSSLTPSGEITFMDEDVFVGNAAGTALRQFFLKSPIHIPIGGQIESRVINLAAVANAIQIIGFGVRPDSRKKIT